MSTPPAVTVNVTTGSTGSTPTVAAPSKLDSILQIIQIALNLLKNVPVVGTGAGLVGAFLTIYQNAVALYEAESGQPFDITKIPLEQPVP
jgi:hypothetical protein